MVHRPWSSAFSAAGVGRGGSGEADGSSDRVGVQMSDVWDLSVGVGGGSSRVRGGGGPVLGLLHEGVVQ